MPTSVAVAESFTGLKDAPLFPEEAALVARAVDKRHREFATGRSCARTALARIGVPPAPILRGARGAPQWPAGVVGSITHTDGYCAAAVARDADVVTIGIDAEPDAELPDGVLGVIALDDERAMVHALRADRPGQCWDRLLFCAKEAVYKAWFPLTGAWLDFGEARVALRPETATFDAELLVPGPVVDGRRLRGFAGRWLARDGLLLASVAVEAGSLEGATVADR